VQHNYVLFPRGSYLPSPKASNASSPDLEPLVFTVSAAAPKPNTVSGTMAGVAASVSDSYTALFEWALTTFLRSGGNTTTSIITADARVFHSAARQLAENAKKKADGGEGGEGAEGGADDGLTELERAHLEAEQQLQDDEDEEEEDYDPGSDGESEGSGSSSEEEEDGDGDGEGEDFDDDDEGDEE